MTPDIIKKLINNKKISINLEAEIIFRIKDEYFEPGTVRIHLPAPINASWLKEGQLLDADPFFRMMSVEDYPQRSAYFNEILTQNTDFRVKYAFLSEHQYLCPNLKTVDSAPQKTFSAEETDRYKALNHCGCESYTALPSDRVLISDICEDDGIHFKKEYQDFLFKNGIDISDHSLLRGSLAKRIFDLVTTKYSANDAESLNIVFTAMCRMCRIPARWQGGWACKDRGPAFAHDWCMIHLLPYGWIYCDCEFAKEYRDLYGDFFFGNIDPCMVPTASVPSANLYPAKDYPRADRIFNTYGEAEIIPGKMTSDGHFEGRGLKQEEFTSFISISWN